MRPRDRFAGFGPALIVLAAAAAISFVILEVAGNESPARHQPVSPDALEPASDPDAERRKRARERRQAEARRRARQRRARDNAGAATVPDRPPAARGERDGDRDHTDDRGREDSGHDDDSGRDDNGSRPSGSDDRGGK